MNSVVVGVRPEDISVSKRRNKVRSKSPSPLWNRRDLLIGSYLDGITYLCRRCINRRGFQTEGDRGYESFPPTVQFYLKKTLVSDSMCPHEIIHVWTTVHLLKFLILVDHEIATLKSGEQCTHEIFSNGKESSLILFLTCYKEGGIYFWDQLHTWRLSASLPLIVMSVTNWNSSAEAQRFGAPFYPVMGTPGFF